MILLDTHLIVWLTEGDNRLGPEAAEAIGTRHPAYYSAISVMELQIKAMRGKLRMPEGLCSILDDVGLRQLSWVGEHAEAMGELPELAGHDPFDRALVAQAAAEQLAFLTADRRLLALGRPWILDASR
ncbi:type II toxin-antitoxin system VapC family toxin [Aeromicrobium sp. YIM 150415]|uniref:type II toxin-antitoxin system VapC family toxin n=1 Tax=Aeromicrobium sp. YIM 150415 TaxID=2803912 RepID=UPI001966A525|nr:type II toxin-antitoxin system VapC family toxin [Aeromicrobium sp. YIM 150415]MBM9462060.1 type II toxin-antitoxin system VapC family toxin [Aeromicrobium sp. YIM 150415]